MLRYGTLGGNGTLVLKAEENTGFINRGRSADLVLEMCRRE
jgi:hypothetical protein